MSISEKKRRKAIQELCKINPFSNEKLMAAKRRLAKKYGIEILRNSDILKEMASREEERRPTSFVDVGRLKRILRKRAVRTLSGIAPVAVLTMPYPCPGKCAYCPTEKDVPQSYLSNEPAVMRAIRCDYDPYVQVQMRLRALEANGHRPEKIELIVIGGTWSVLPAMYKYWFITECFRGANDFQNKKFKIKNKKHKYKNIKILQKKLFSEQKKNEEAKYKIIGVTLETRPDYIDEEELLEMRELGCTRVELGVQAVNDKILKFNRRGHGVKEIVLATKLLKDFGFKVTYHIMPGLPGSTPAKDLKMFKQLFSDERFQPDQLKFYPTVVTRGSLLYKWWRAGKYKPYPQKLLEKLIIDCKKAVPEYVRIVRLIRDIPEESIMAGNRVTNLRQVMQARGVECRCIRCREVGGKQLAINNLQLIIKKYKASDGWEYFLQYTDKNKNTLYGFCRLRLSSCNIKHLAHNIFKEAVLIRELHVYGELMPAGKGKKIQHAGLGKKLMDKAEKIARVNGFKKIIVISGVGARGYYRKLGYKLENSYMVKSL